MSMNLVIAIEKPMLDLTTNKEVIHYVYLEVFQTPTDVTRKIIEMDDPLKGYEEWALENSEDEEEKVYHDPQDEFLVEDGHKDDDPSLYKVVIYNYGKEHIENLRNEIESAKRTGYKISYEVW